MVSVLMSVADPASPLSLLHTQLELEAEVGIDRVSSSTSHSKSIVYGIADCLTINGLR